MRKIFTRALAAVLAMFCLVAAAAGCSDDQPTSADSAPTVSENAASLPESDTASDLTRSVQIVSSSPFISAGADITFTAAIEPAGTIVWASSDESVATVSADGVVTGVAQGQVLITASSADGRFFDSAAVRVAKEGLIFLSPSRQDWNPYSAGDTNEMEQCEAIAALLEEILLGYGCEVYVCPAKHNLERRAEMAAEMESVCYVAIHSNAGGDGYEGTTALFHPDDMDSIALALALFNEVAALTPTDESVGPYNGMNKGNIGVGYAEIREPNRFGIPTTLLEVEYHDKAETAQWIIDHKPEIAQSIADGIMKWLSSR